MNNTSIGHVYMITSPTNRIYIGSTINIDRRVNQYKANYHKTQIKISNSINKYGWEAHKFEIIWSGDKKDMLKYEALIGLYFNVLNPENLNCRLPKINSSYISFSQETRQKMSDSAKGRIISQELKNLISKLHTGKIVSKETRQKMSSWQIGRKMSEEAKKKMSLAKIGKKRSAEANLKISKARQKPVIQFDLNMNFIKEWDSATIAAKELNIKGGHINTCCRGERKSCNGFKWKLKNK